MLLCSIKWLLWWVATGDEAPPAPETESGAAEATDAEATPPASVPAPGGEAEKPESEKQ